MTGKAVKVHALVEYTCPRCRKPATQLGLANVLPDGRIGDGEILNPDDPCGACKRSESDQERAEYYSQTKRRREQKKWAERKVWPAVSPMKDGA